MRRLYEHGRLPAWLTIDSLNTTFQKQASAWHQAGFLDAGEAEALSLAQQIKATWFLTDDAAARLLGNTIGIEVHGSLGIILWAAATKHIYYPEATENLENLVKSSLWMSPKIFDEARKSLETIFI